MMTSARMKELLNRKPFRPFRLFLSDGSHHDVPHPEFAWVFGGRIFVGEAANGSSEEHWPLKELSILHVTRVEERRPQKPKK
jgi:hypothetical protein